MELFSDWCNTHSWLISAISIVLSGLVSWLITFVYFKKSNNESAIISIIEPIFHMMSNPISKENNSTLEMLCKQYAMKYLNSQERVCVRNFGKTYAEMSEYNRSAEAANAIIEFYHKELVNQHIDVEIEPIEDNENNVVGYDFPISADAELYDILKNLFDNQLEDFENYEEIDAKINSILINNAKAFFSVPDSLHFFKNTSFVKVVEEYEKNKWANIFDNYNRAKIKFNKMFFKVRGATINEVQF